MKRRVLWIASALALAFAATIAAPALRAGGETINFSDINKIKAEGLQRSQVMELCSWLSDVHAPRLTGSPTSQKAAEWAVAQDEGVGPGERGDRAVGQSERLRSRLDATTNSTCRCTAPEKFPIPGTPTAWTPGTNGLVSGEVVLVTATRAEELAPFKGKLKGKWVLTQAAPDVPAMWEAQAKRFTADELAAMEVLPAAAGSSSASRRPASGRPRRRSCAGPGPAGHRPRRSQPAAGSRRQGQRERRPRGSPAAACRRRGGFGGAWQCAQRLLQGGRRARHDLDRAPRPRHLHHQRQPGRRPRDDGAGRCPSPPNTTAASPARSPRRSR